ncbi:MAG TPA: PqqD family protein [Candidatus Polarisedimenticolaceae bacterium]|nr:PqqD family protein [Candidatus Polarisedimenticolaceae bacterium]
MVLPGRAEVKVLNPVGIRIFGLLDGAHTVGEIADVIAAEYEVSEGEARDDVRAFLDQLDAHGMLAGEAR